MGVHREKPYDGYFCFQMAYDGELHIRYGSRGRSYRGPLVWMGYPGPVMGYRPVSPQGTWIHRYLCFTGPLAQVWWRERLLPRLPQILDDSEDWANSFDEVLQIDDAETPWSHAEKVNRFEALLIRLAKQSGAQEPEEAWLTTAKALLEDDRNFTPEISEIARECGMAPSTFRRRFARAMGSSPRDWALERRIRSARALLEDQTLSIGEIAAHLGYPDPFSFSKQFKAKEGLPPSQWRNAKWNEQVEQGV